MIATYVVSSAWHGFYAGYYAFFVTVAIYTEASRKAKAKISPWFKAAGPFISNLYDIACMILSHLSVNYFVMSFILLSLENTHMIWSSFGYIPNIIVVAIYLISMQVSSRHSN